MQLYQGKGGLVDRLLAELMKRAEKAPVPPGFTVDQPNWSNLF